MNDKKFMELLNLYVDREIDAEDALKLEAEVASNTGRRRVYDQYCKMQKACSMLTSETAAEAADPDRVVVTFPTPSFWGRAPLIGALAAAACILVVVGIRERGNPGAAAPTAPRTLASTVDLPARSDAMTPVFLTRASSTEQGGAAGLIALDSPSQDAELGWIGGVHMAPMFPAPNSQLIGDPKSGLKAPGALDPQAVGVVQEPIEMTAFRFQR
jgi:hypothetical protein